MSWFKQRLQPKEEHPMQEEWEQVCRPEPPQGGDATLPVRRIPPPSIGAFHRVPSGFGSYVPRAEVDDMRL